MCFYEYLRNKMKNNICNEVKMVTILFVINGRLYYERNGFR